MQRARVQGVSGSGVFTGMWSSGFMRLAGFRTYGVRVLRLTVIGLRGIYMSMGWFHAWGICKDLGSRDFYI